MSVSLQYQMGSRNLLKAFTTTTLKAFLIFFSYHKQMIKVVVVDIDGTLVPDKEYVRTSISYGLVVLAVISIIYQQTFGAAALIIVAVGLLWCSNTLNGVNEAIQHVREKSVKVYLSTARYWPLISPFLLARLQISPDRVYFRTTQNKSLSKLRNMQQIQQHEQCRVEEMLLVDNEESNLSLVKNAGYQTLHAPHGLHTLLLLPFTSK